jgi:DNA-binding NarL/FixJ family response regulator
VNGEIKVAIFEDHEIFRRGLVAVLAEDRRLRVVTLGPLAAAPEDIDVAVVSSKVASGRSFRCPIIVYSDDSERSNGAAAGNEVAGVLDSDQLTGAQLRATVHATVAGLRVNTQLNGAGPVLEPRTRRVLELMADGYSTREIAELMSYSERTIKKLITTLQQRFDARSRAHIVAQAIRRGLI